MYKKIVQKKISNNQSGFTLIELLLAIFVFSLLILAIAAIYLAFSKSQNHTRASQQVLNDAQYVMEIMAREIRNDEIFDYTPEAADCNAKLDEYYDQCILLKRGNGQLVGFAVNSNQYLAYIIFDCNEDYSVCDWRTNPRSFTYLLFPSRNRARATDFGIYIEPSSDPFDSDINQQPKVTIKLEVTYFSEDLAKQASHRLQTTVSSRLYKR